MKLQEIKKFARDFKMPETLQLDMCTKITNLNMFFESHIVIMESSCNTKYVKMLHYNRILRVIELLRKNKTSVLKIENFETSSKPITQPFYETKNDVKDKNNSEIDFSILESKSNSAMKPNNEFEIDVKEQKKMDKNIDLNNSESAVQMSLF